jgi:hypothetical protein
LARAIAANMTWGAVLALALTLALTSALSLPAAAAGCPTPVAETLTIDAATLCVVFGDADAPGKALLHEWIARSARIVADYYGRFPAALVTLQIGAMDGDGVGGGRTTNEGSLLIRVRVGRAASAATLSQDWVLVHEMIHLALPEVGDMHNWLAEGLATYVEGIARAQAGNRDIADVWAEDRRSMPLGLPRSGEGGMDQTRTWARTYWGGALFCLQADIELRRQTANRLGLQAALQAILRETGGYANERAIDSVLQIGDAATGTHVLEDLYQHSKATPNPMDLAALWKQLGVPDDPLTQPFDDRAPLAPIRIAITAARPKSRAAPPAVNVPRN